MTGALADQLVAAREETSRLLAVALTAGPHVRMGTTHGLADRVLACTPCVHLIETPFQPTLAVLGSAGAASCFDCFQGRKGAGRVRSCSDCGAEAPGPLYQVVAQLEHVVAIRLLCDRCAGAE